MRATARLEPDMGTASLARRFVIGRSAGALLIALGAGALAMTAPPVALLVLAVLAAYAMLGRYTLNVDLMTLAGPALAALAVGAFAGLPGAVGVLFVWRLFADARWSVNEARRLAVAAGRAGEVGFRALAHAWATPLYGLAVVAYTAPHIVAGLPLDLPHAPVLVPAAFAVAAGALVFDWALRRAADWRLGDLAAAPAAHLAAHHALFLLAYGLTMDVSAGLTAMIAWRLAHAAPMPAAGTALLTKQ